MKIWVITALSFFAFAGTAAGQGIGLGFSDEQSDRPITVEADQGIEWNRDDAMYVARGNAMAQRGEVQIDADILTALYREAEAGTSEIYRLEALGNVRITSANEKARGDRAVYDMDQAVVIILGDDLEFQTKNDVITARDSLEYWEAKSIAVARGDAKATRDGRTIEAEALTAYFEEAQEKDLELSKMEAVGGVTIRTEREVARGENGVYNAKSGIATLTGNVRITREDTQLNGDRAEVNMNTGISRLLSTKDENNSGRVRGIFLPKKKSDQKN